MAVHRTRIDGLLVVDWPTHGDERGFFRQTYQVGELEQALGRAVSFRQGNHARSAPGVLRGFHAEPWDKLVCIIRGRALAAIADIRPDSPTFAQVETFELGDDCSRARLFVAEGLANAYCTLGDDDVDYVYDVSREWTPTADKRAVAWNDPDLAVSWPVASPSISIPDTKNPTLRERFPDHPIFTSAGRRSSHGRVRGVEKEAT